MDQVNAIDCELSVQDDIDNSNFKLSFENKKAKGLHTPQQKINNKVSLLNFIDIVKNPYSQEIDMSCSLSSHISTKPKVNNKIIPKFQNISDKDLYDTAFGLNILTYNKEEDTYEKNENITKCLENRDYFNDTIIQFYLNLLKKEYSVDNKSDSKISCFGTYFYDTLLRKNNWSDKFSFLKRKKKEINRDILIFPINLQKDQHWVT